jgi:peptidoglycan/LPS O-acetylase OafA/YrhL
MGQTQRLDHQQSYLPCLEGIRGYGFLLVFCAHYFSPYQLGHPGTVRFKLLTAIQSLAIFAVPAFFVLSGYLIGAILYDTRNREGYFKVFYYRRILRVFPVYYLTLLAIACFYAIGGFSFVADYHFWIHFLYIQNLSLHYPPVHNDPVNLIHFWSLAVEEQFYLVWPLIVWLFPDRRKLIGIASALIACSFIVRLAAPLFLYSPMVVQWYTPTRVDAILMGVVLALMRHDASFERIKPFAKWIVLSGVAAAFLVANEPWVKTYRAENFWIPLVNVVALALIVAVLEDRSLLNRACSQRWVCWLGSLSYSMYVFHLTFAPYFISSLTPHLRAYMRQPFAVLTSGALAFALTLVLSILSYRFIEGPIIKLKRHINYGPAKRRSVAHPVGERVLVSAGD